MNMTKKVKGPRKTLYIMEKKKVIKKAYGKSYDALKDYINENGFVDCVKNRKISLIPFFDISEIEFKGNEARPKSLKGIENNNGWNVLKGIKNEITHEGDIWILNKYGNVELWLESQFLAIGYATHWKPIIKPENLPLY